MHNPSRGFFLRIMLIIIEYRPFLSEECTFPMFSILTVRNQWTLQLIMKVGEALQTLLSSNQISWNTFKEQGEYTHMIKLKQEILFQKYFRFYMERTFTLSIITHSNHEEHPPPPPP